MVSTSSSHPAESEAHSHVQHGRDCSMRRGRKFVVVVVVISVVAGGGVVGVSAVIVVVV